MKRILLLLVLLAIALSVISCGGGNEAQESNNMTEKGSDAIINNENDTCDTENAEDIVDNDRSESESDKSDRESSSENSDVDLPKIEF